MTAVAAALAASQRLAARSRAAVAHMTAWNLSPCSALTAPRRRASAEMRTGLRRPSTRPHLRGNRVVALILNAPVVLLRRPVAERSPLPDGDAVRATTHVASPSRHLRQWLPPGDPSTIHVLKGRHYVLV